MARWKYIESLAQHWFCPTCFMSAMGRHLSTWPALVTQNIEHFARIESAYSSTLRLISWSTNLAATVSCSASRLLLSTRFAVGKIMKVMLEPHYTASWCSSTSEAEGSWVP